jgi:hypothetical protein
MARKKAAHSVSAIKPRLKRADRSTPAPNPALSFDDHYLAERRARPDAGWIRKSSSFFPDLSWAVSQRGCLPLPAQVSAGWAGFLYFGNTCGYGRRAWFSFLAMPDALSFLALPDALRSSCCKRRSSCDFSSFAGQCLGDQFVKQPKFVHGHRFEILFCHVLNSDDLFLNSDGLFLEQPGIPAINPGGRCLSV